MACLVFDKNRSCLSHQGWLLEAKRDFRPREMTDLNDRTRLTDCLAFQSKNMKLTHLLRENLNVHNFDSIMIQLCIQIAI